jgi:hypothetical protein
MTGMIARIVLYMLWAAAAVQLALIEVRYVTGQDPFSEFGYVESIQSLLLAAGMILLFWMARTQPQRAQLALCGALAMLILLIRENDQPLELFLPHGAWKWIALPVVIVLVWQCYRHRHVLITQLHSLTASRAFGVYLAAGSTLLFSRLFGSTRYWQEVMSERYFRLVKNAAEEGLELFALGLIFAATVEWFLGTDRSDDR